MGGWCSYKIAQLFCRPGPLARGGRRQARPPSRGPAVPEGHPGRSRPAPRGRSAGRAASSLGPAAPSGRPGRTEAAVQVEGAAGCSEAPAVRPDRRQEPGLRQLLRGQRSLEEPVGARSPWLLRRPRGRPGNLWAQVEASRVDVTSCVPGQEGITVGASARGKRRVFTDFRVLARKGLGVLSLSILFPNFIKVLKRHQLCFKRLIEKKKRFE